MIDATFMEHVRDIAEEYDEERTIKSATYRLNRVLGTISFYNLAGTAPGLRIEAVEAIASLMVVLEQLDDSIMGVDEEVRKRIQIVAEGEKTL